MKGLFSRRGKHDGGFRSARSKAAVELQFHPADIRKQVRYIFLSRRDLWLLGIGLFLAAAFLLGGLGLLPKVIESRLLADERRELLTERDTWDRRIDEQVGKLSRLEPRSHQLRLDLEKLYLAYGLSNDESAGQGGFPEPPAELPETAASKEAGSAVISSDELRQSVGTGRRLLSSIRQEIQVAGAFAREIEDFQNDYAEQVRTTPSTMPLPAGEFVLTSPFSERVNPFTNNREHHAGLDLAALQGTAIHAAADGVVVFSGRFPRRQSVGWWRYGNLVVIRHNESFITLYGHCHEVKVRQGEKVRRGQLIATVGSTGWSSNPHLHYEVRRRENPEDRFVPVDPRIYILDYKWADQERLLVRSRRSPMPEGYEPLPPLFAR